MQCVFVAIKALVNDEFLQPLHHSCALALVQLKKAIDLGVTVTCESRFVDPGTLWAHPAVPGFLQLGCVFKGRLYVDITNPLQPACAVRQAGHSRDGLHDWEVDYFVCPRTGFATTS